MFTHLDLIFANNPKGDITIFLVSQKGRDFITDKLRRLWTDLKIVEMPGRVETVTIDEKRAKLAYRHASGVKFDLDKFWVSEEWHGYSFEEVVLNARYIADQRRARESAKAITAHFGPLLQAAIEARDKREITNILNRFPSIVEKSLFISGLSYGENSFPELRREGVTLANWHEHEA